MSCGDNAGNTLFLVDNLFALELACSGLIQWTRNNLLASPRLIDAYEDLVFWNWRKTGELLFLAGDTPTVLEASVLRKDVIPDT